MDLLRPEDHADAYLWAAVALAHLSIGVALAALVAWVLGRFSPQAPRGVLAFGLVVIGYLTIWEIGLQRLGAGWPDALLDAAMVAVGAAVPVLAWRRQELGLAMVLAGAAVALWHGIDSRKSDK